MNIHHHHPEHLLPSSRTSSLASSIFPTPVRALLTLLQNVRISTILASAGSRLRQAVAGQCLQASLHSERGTRRLEQHLYITADCFACVVLAGFYSAQRYWLTDFLTISAKDATGCLSLALGRAALPAQRWILLPLLPRPCRGHQGHLLDV